MTQHSYYYERILNGPDQLIDKVNESVTLLEQVADTFDCIAVTGVSGMIVGSAVAVRLRKQLIVVRKTIANCHAEQLVEGEPVDSYRYVIVDDCVCTGRTVRRIREHLKGDHASTLLYDNYGCPSLSSLPTPTKSETCSNTSN